MREGTVSFFTMCSILVATAACGKENVTTPPTSVAEFEQRLENLRDGSNIVAITAVIAKDQMGVWAPKFAVTA